ncbi:MULTISPECIES: haloacid dehalogenase type II [Pacificibacter]|uniref:haloacid dehalogenase type II n=1 Tax=Pacificibacter TaxID=1042323 RepID=UPI001C094CF7|nr:MULTISPECIES: haloacid dehalogenase type II [Pacificibacter]MBU2935266.1 haloacid dehalogenase type II [Pacificibacter marinus]MDO6615420.1 haloacid dehalogenase type II [Pacificibacter sp. 1_MG-2023]
MTDLGRPSVLVFDVNETLLDITTLEPLFERLFGDRAVLREWFPELILYSQTLTLSDIYTPFGTLAGSMLRMVGANKGIDVTDADIAELKQLFGQMPAHKDVVPALTALRDAGYTLVTLTNSAAAPSPTPLENAGIAGLFDHHFNVSEVEKFKPHRSVYDIVPKALNTPASDMCMVACHVWDTIGAQAAGYQGAFIARPHNSVFEVPHLRQPDYACDDLAVFARRMIP